MENSSESNFLDDGEMTTVPTESLVTALPKGNRLVLNLMMAVKIFCCVLIIINNIIILLSVRGWRGLSKTSRLLIAHLAYADLLSGVGIIIRTITVAVYGLKRFTCIIPMGLAAMSGSSSITGVLYLSLEAFFSVRSNNVYLTKSMYQMAVAGVLVSWIFHLVFIIAGILTSLPANNVRICYFGNPYYLRAYLTAFSTMLICHIPVVLGLQVSTYRQVSSRLGRITGSQVSPSAGGSQNTPSSGEQQSTAVLTPAVTSKRLMVIKKLTILSIFCGILFFVSWGPYAFVLFLYSTVQSDRPEVITPSYLINLGTVTTVNSLANIYIYLARSKEFRRSVRESFGCYTVVNNT